MYPHKYGMSAAALKQSYNPNAMDPKLKLLPEMMKEGGYRTHMVGKWHLGQAEKEYLPWNRGFESFLGFNEAESNYFEHKLGHLSVLRNSTGPIDRTGQYITDIFTNETLTKLEDTEKPNFVYLAYNAPHSPVSAPEEVKDELRKLYYGDGFKHLKPIDLDFHGAIRVIDNGIERLYQKAKSLERETIFIVTSDNGGPLNALDGCNWPYRGGKSNFEEGGIKTSS